LQEAIQSHRIEWCCLFAADPHLLMFEG
jgi:hypothetical protein